MTIRKHRIPNQCQFRRKEAGWVRDDSFSVIVMDHRLKLRKVKSIESLKVRKLCVSCSICRILFSFYKTKCKLLALKQDENHKRYLRLTRIIFSSARIHNCQSFLDFHINRNTRLLHRRGNVDSKHDFTLAAHATSTNADRTA
jgi:hypothetical protein